MNFGESSPEESAFNKESDRKAAEYFAKEHKKRLLEMEAALQVLYRKLNLQPGQTLSDYFGLTPRIDGLPAKNPTLDLEIEDNIDRFFEDVGRLLTEDGTAEDFPSILGAPRSDKPKSGN